jgi:hypothetical protein
MPKHLLILSGIIIGFLAIWSGVTLYFQHTIDQPKYTVVQQNKNYEIRQYDSYIIAQTQVQGDYRQAASQGFRILADYIFGNNTKQSQIKMTAPVNISGSESIDMTVPVTIKESENIQMTAPVTIKESESIQMTAPVTISKQTKESTESSYIVSFVMPFDYTLQTLPKPNNPQVEIKTQSARKVAALKFSWYAGANRVEAKKQELLNLLKQDQFTRTGPAEYAGYDAPLTAPWLRRNEVMIEIE